MHVTWIGLDIFDVYLRHYEMNFGLRYSDETKIRLSLAMFALIFLLI